MQESLVIFYYLCLGEFFISLVHTARQAMSFSSKYSLF